MSELIQRGLSVVLMGFVKGEAVCSTLFPLSYDQLSDRERLSLMVLQFNRSNFHRNE